MKRRTPAARAAFTLVELLVAMALIIFIMYILAEAFAAGTTAFRNLKAIGDMNERLRSASTILRRYLQADHFDGRRRLSDADFWKNGPPQEGFFRIIQSGASTPEGTDLDNLPSLRSTSQALHFAVKLRGNNRGDFFRASVPNNSPLLNLPFADSRFQDTGGVICSPAAEVAFFLRDSGIKTEDPDSTTGNNQQSLYTMYFRQRLLVPDNTVVQQYSPPGTWPVAYGNWPNYLEVSATQDPTTPANLYFNNLQDVTMPARRWGKLSALPDTSSTSPTNYIDANSYPILADENQAMAGSDVLLSDVLSCHISVLLSPAAYGSAAASRFVDLGDPNDPVAVAYRNPASAPPLNGAGPVPAVFDTWSSRKDDVYDYSNWQSTIPMFKHSTNGSLIRILAIKIELRIWDGKTKQTRMTSVVVDL